MKKIILISALYLICANCTIAQIFTRVTDSPVANQNNPTYHAAWGDYDNDGDLDLFTPYDHATPDNPTGRNLLFQNNCNGNFTKITAIPGGIVSDPTLNHPYCYWIDYDNDGNSDLYQRADIYWTGNSGTSSLYHNNGDGTFVKLNNAITYGAGGFSWVDFDNDGLLDVFLGGTNAKLFKNTGTDFTQQASFYQSGNGGIAWADYDNDGYMDVYITRIGVYRYLYHNNGDGTFTLNTTAGTVVTAAYTSYGCAWADYDNDGYPDLWVSDNTSYHGDHLYHNNNGNGTFTEITTGPLVNTPGVDQAGASWADYDNDGDLDLAATTYDRTDGIINGGRTLLFVNNGDGTFIRNTTEIVSTDTVQAFGAEWADYDNDGDMDLVVIEDGPPNYNHLYKNTLIESGGTNHNWFKIKCIGVSSNRDAVGARVYAKANINGNTYWQMREINANGNWGGEGGGTSHIVHIGLGDATMIDSLKIVWPASNITQIITDVTINNSYQITEGINTLVKAKVCKADLPTRNPGYIEGKVYYDKNNDCSFDTISDVNITNRMMEARIGPYFVFSNSQGEYKFRLADGTYNIKEVNVPDDIWQLQNCQQDSIYSIHLAGGNVVIGKDFAEKPGPLANDCEATVDIYSVPGIFPGPCTLPPNFPNLTTPCPGGYYWQYCITITNNGTNNIGPQSTLQVVLDPGMTFYPSVLPNGCGFGTPVITGSGTIITWTGNNPITPGNTCSFCFNVTVNSGLSSLSTANFTAQCGSLTYPTTDQEPQQNSCSCDPNDKLVAPKGCGTFNNISKNQPLTYTVRFQNTGTGPAHNITLRDQLDSDLDITTLRILLSSHTISHVEIIPDNALIISYNNIELPDSNSNEPGSHGFVTFSVKPKPNLSEATTITNQAGIYFDFNEVVLTNTTLNTLYNQPTPIADFETKHSCTNTGLVYDFAYTGNTADNATFFWDFGNGASPSTSTEQSPTDIIYSTIGTKQITLTVTRFGCTAIINKNVEVATVLTGKDNKKVIICHNGNTIEVSLNALPAHLAHGDCVGECGNNSNKIAKQSEQSNDEIYDVNIIPNPSNGKFTLLISVNSDDNISFYLENEKIVIGIYDVLGKIIYKSSIINPNSTIDISSYSKGIYFYKITSQKNFISAGKLIIQ